MESVEDVYYRGWTHVRNMTETTDTHHEPHTRECVEQAEQAGRHGKRRRCLLQVRGFIHTLPHKLPRELLTYLVLFVVLRLHTRATVAMTESIRAVAWTRDRLSS